MNRGARKAAIFMDDACCGRFVELLSEFPVRFGLAIHGFTLMPNHYHLMLESRSARLSAAMSYLQSRYSQWLNQRYEWDGPLFRGRFRNRVVLYSEYWRHLLAYIHLNPVRAHLRKSPDKAEWTSHTAYVGLGPRPSWLCCEELMDLYGDLEVYQAYLRDLQYGRSVGPEEYDPDGIWGGPTSGFVRARPRPALGEDARIPTWGEGERHTDPVEAAQQELEDTLQVPRDAFIQSVIGRKGNRARWVAAWWLTWAGRVPNKRVAEILGISRSGVSQQARKAREMRQEDEQMDAWMTALEGRYRPE